MLLVLRPMGKDLFQSPRRVWLDFRRWKGDSTSEPVGTAGGLATESSGEGDSAKPCLLSTWQAPDFLLVL